MQKEDQLMQNESRDDAMRFSNLSCSDFILALAGDAPVPGGGGASAMIGAIGTALGNMIGSLTVGNPKYSVVQEEMQVLKDQADRIQCELLDLVRQDAVVFAPLAAAYRLPKTTPEERAHKAAVMEASLEACCRVPLQIMKCCAEAIDLLEAFEKKGSRMAVSDAGVGAAACLAAMKGAFLNVRINTKSMSDREKAARYNQKAEGLLKAYTLKAETIFERINAIFD